jgi:hypothetical protein
LIIIIIGKSKFFILTIGYNMNESRPSVIQTPNAQSDDSVVFQDSDAETNHGESENIVAKETDIACDNNSVEDASSNSRSDTSSPDMFNYSSDEEMPMPKIFTAASTSNMKFPARKRKAKNSSSPTDCYYLPVIKEAYYNSLRGGHIFCSQKRQEVFDESIPVMLQHDDFVLSSEFLIGSKMKILIGILKEESLEPHSRIQLMITQLENQIKFSAYLFLNKCVKALEVGFYAFSDSKGISKIPIGNGSVLVDFYSDKFSRWAKLMVPNPEFPRYNAYKICMCSTTFGELMGLIPCLKQIFHQYVSILMQGKLSLNHTGGLKCRRRLQFEDSEDDD